MPRPPSHTHQPGPPFNSPAAARLRAALGMAPEHVAHSLRSSYGLPYATPDLVVAWERGIMTPSSPELTALAGVLWCSPAELIGRPRTLREHRIARGFAPEDVARAVGHAFAEYARMEESGQWEGSERQSAALAELLDLSLPDLVTVTGREGRLGDLLRTAARTRWQPYVKPVAKLLPLDRRLVEPALRELHHVYQGQPAAAPQNWSGGDPAGFASDVGRDFLDGIVDAFWTIVQNRASGTGQDSTG